MGKLYRILVSAVLVMVCATTLPAISHAIPDGASGTWGLTWYVDHQTLHYWDDSVVVYDWSGDRTGGSWQPSDPPYGFGSHNPTHPTGFTLVLHEFDGTDYGELKDPSTPTIQSGWVSGVTLDGATLLIHIAYEGGASGVISLYDVLENGVLKDSLSGDFDEDFPPIGHITFQGEVELNRVAAVPEPSTFFLVAAALLGAAGFRRFARR
ncbi:MAG: PEP-CTERM sorting domain-containing protein [Geobacteraceae bacterium]|nr:PEP-CTERM sorting domain-containing protein [Geobacteraceae bacterium]